MKRIIYADNAATTMLDIDAFEAMKPFLLENYGNASQPYSFSRNVKKVLKEARHTIAQCINADDDEIYFTSGGTESDNWAIKGILSYGDTRAVITSQVEHHAILNACAAIERFGYPVVYLPVDQTGRVQPESLKSVITPNTKLVSIMMANNEVGTIQPIQELCDIAHQNSALFHTDAVQAVGHIEIDVKSLGIDMLSASAHKFNGPKGIGFLYVKRGTPLSSFLDGGAQEQKKRAGTENVPAIVGMSIALENNCKSIRENRQKVLALEEQLISLLQEYNIDFLRNGNSNHIPGNISLSFKGIEGETLLHRLDLMGICVSTGSACDSVNTQVSHVLMAMNIDPLYSKGTIRLSLGKDNTSDEVNKVVDSIKRILSSQ